MQWYNSSPTRKLPYPWLYKHPKWPVQVNCEERKQASIYTGVHCTIYTCTCVFLFNSLTFSDSPLIGGDRVGDRVGDSYCAVTIVIWFQTVALAGKPLFWCAAFQKKNLSVRVRIESPSAWLQLLNSMIFHTLN